MVELKAFGSADEVGDIGFGFAEQPGKGVHMRVKHPGYLF
jgi:hypothetical protein